MKIGRRIQKLHKCKPPLLFWATWYIYWLNQFDFIWFIYIVHHIHCTLNAGDATLTISKRQQKSIFYHHSAHSSTSQLLCVFSDVVNLYRSKWFTTNLLQQNASKISSVHVRFWEFTRVSDCYAKLLLLINRCMCFTVINIINKILGKIIHVNNTMYLIHCIQFLANWHLIGSEPKQDMFLFRAKTEQTWQTFAQSQKPKQISRFNRQRKFGGQICSGFDSEQKCVLFWLIKDVLFC